MKNSLPTYSDSGLETIITATPKRSFLDSGVVGRIDRKEIFEMAHYNRPIPYWSLRDSNGALSKTKYILHNAINKNRLHDTIAQKKDALDTESAQYTDILKALNEIRSAIGDMQFNTARHKLTSIIQATNQQGLDSLYGTIQYYERQAIICNDDYEQIGELMCTNGKIDAQKVESTLTSGCANNLILFLAQNIDTLDKKELAIIRDQLGACVIKALQQGEFLKALNTLDQVDYFQMTYHDIGFRFSLDGSSIPELFKPEIFSQIGLHSSKASFIQKIKELFGSQKAFCDKLVTQAEQHYNADNFYYRRAMSGARTYQAKQDYIDFMKQQVDGTLASGVRQVLPKSNKGFTLADLWRTLGF